MKTILFRIVATWEQNLKRQTKDTFLYKISFLSVMATEKMQKLNAEA
jgi:hypothetical protein